jgi:DNA-3-methyladenine glycosylase II
MPRVSLAAATADVAARDRALARVIETAGPFRPRARNADGHFGALVRAIAFQQLAGAAATAIHGRFRALVDGPLTPESVLALREEEMRAVGLSNAKTVSIRDLATKVADGTVVLGAGINRQSDEEVITRLSTVRGIGRWTAEMFLLFELRRLDVWPVDDLGVRQGYGMTFAHEPAPTAKQLQPLGDRFRPYRSIVAWYCWQAVHLHRAGIPPADLSLR